jgi:predicted DNA-binding protein (MmcQ/YjbR family)
MKATRKTNALAWLRRECHALIGTEEKIAWGHPTFHVGGHTIAAFEVFHGRPSIAVWADRDRQEFLLEHFGFFKTPYSGRYGWVSAWVDAPAPWGLIRSLLAEAYTCAVARPRRAAPSSRGTRSSPRKRSRKLSGRSTPKRAV